MLAEAIAEAEQADAHRELGLALLRQEMVEFAHSSWRDGLNRSDRSRQLLQRTGELHLAAGSVAHHGLALLYLGEIAKARAYVTRYLQEARRLAESSAFTLSLSPFEARCVAAMEPDAAPKVNAMLEPARSLAERTRNPNALWTTNLAWGECLLQWGRLDDDIAMLDNGLALRKAHRDVRSYATSAYWLLPRAYLRKSNRTAAENKKLVAAQREARAIARKHACWRPPTLVNEALLCEQRGKSAQADRHFAEAVAVARVQQAGLFVADGLYEWGLVLKARGEHSRASEHLREAREIAEKGGNVWLQQQCDETRFD